MPDADQPPTVPPRPPFPKGRQLDEDASGAVDALLEGLPRERSLLIEYLHRIQDGLGHIPVDHLAALAHALKLSQAEVYEVATFYAHFQVAGEGITPPPLTVRVCGGIACEMAGGGELLGALKKALGDRVQILAAPCVGACDRAPVAKVGTREIGRAAPDSVSRAIDGGETAQPAPVPSGDGTFEIYRQCQAGERTRETVMAEVDRAGLRGMGGAGFPVTKKWRFVLEAPKPRVLVVNADEGEPGTFKDRHCLETNPRRVLEGALIAAWAVDADDIYIYLRDEYAGIRALLEQEVAALE
ncbi:MAG: NAD(P)H-dependent oxidoreductase subunit E, partial [Rhodospirillales bacterium]|nr:NAD(P)H-dependent oxidoreductase subunit E [Rhodospirillales bacterium]